MPKWCVCQSGACAKVATLLECAIVRVRSTPQLVLKFGKITSAGTIVYHLMPYISSLLNTEALILGAKKFTCD